MPDESCRTCGGTLVKLSICACCGKTMQKKCDTCDGITPKQIHVGCMANDFILHEHIAQNFRITNA